MNISNNSGSIAISGMTGSVTVIGTTVSISTPSGYFTIQPQKTTYHILGEDVEVDGYKDHTTALYISMINIAGREYYDQVKKQGLKFSDELDKAILKRLTVHERNKKLNTLL